MMKAILLERPGPPEALRYVDVAMPNPGPGQVRVRAHSIGVGMPEVWDRLLLADAGKAQALLESGRVLGKMILRP